MADPTRRRTPWALCALLALPAPFQDPSAGGLEVERLGGRVQALRFGGVEYPARVLSPGRSSGATTSWNGEEAAAIAADDFELGTYFARTSVGGAPWTIDLGAWRDGNGPAADFFLFEVGGNDALQVRAVLPGGALGQAVAFSTWTGTGFFASAGPNAGQQVHGLAFASSDLRLPGGAPLPAGQRLQGLQVTSGGVDGACFLAVDPWARPDPYEVPAGTVQVRGEARVWQPLEVWFDGPFASEVDVQPNPFLDFRLQVRFTAPSGRTLDVPGFFAGDGAGADAGRVWAVRFTPDEAGPWTFVASFRRGPLVAVDVDPVAGAPGWFDGAAGSFGALPADPDAPGFGARGPLRYVGEPYLAFADGTRFLKTGAGGPENFLAFVGFDDVQDAGNVGRVHSFPSHVADFAPGDPLFSSSFTGRDSRGAIGALNYLSSVGVNSLYMLVMNLGGDGQDVHPFVGASGSAFDDRHYDLSRLHQWNAVFEHAQRRGIVLHLLFGETEGPNETWLDGGTLGVERKLLYREMVARFGHHPAIKWNLTEENDFPLGQLRNFADYLRNQDPWNHPVCFHNNLDDLSDYQQTVGEARFQATSVQFSPDSAGATAQQLRAWSAQAGHPWVVDLDENAPASTGLQPNNVDDLRKRVLYDAFFSGAAGVSWYLGGQPLPVGGDLDLEDFRTREGMWEDARHAREFLEGLPFHRMVPADGLLTGEHGAHGGGEVFALPGEHYAVYLPNASSSGALDLSGHPGTYRRRWYDPRTGVFAGPSTAVQGGGSVSLGSPPYQPSSDWVCWLDRQ